MNQATNSTAAEANLEARAELFKALGHPTRLLILNLVQIKPRHGQELAAILNLKPATISHHLAKLSGVGLLESRKEQYYQTYSLVEGALKARLDEMVRLPQAGLKAQVEQDAYREKVLKTFFRRGRLTQIPAQRKKRQVILEKLAEEFEPEREYAERAVNHVLLDFHDDVAFLRRALVASGLLERESGVYRRVLDPPQGQDE